MPEIDAAIEALYSDFRYLIDDVSAKDASGLSALNGTFPKIMLLAAASSLEEMIKSELPVIIGRYGTLELGELAYNKIFARNYHQLFDWNSRKATSFFASFGAECKQRFLQKMKMDQGFEAQVASFLEIGALRNELVHQDYANYTVELTADEVYEKYVAAVNFIQSIESIVFGSSQSDSIEPAKAAG